MFYRDHIKKVLPTQQFQWKDQTLHQKVHLLYYKEEKGEPVYTETEWQQVKVGETETPNRWVPCEHFNLLRHRLVGSSHKVRRRISRTIRTGIPNMKDKQSILLSELEKDCLDCQGKGFQVIFGSHVECEECKGTGKVATDKGKELINFVWRHLQD